MNLLQSLSVALSNLRANKLRSLLTMLGIIIGVSAVILMVSILQGMSLNIKKQFAKMGSNLIIIVYHPDKADAKSARAHIDGMSMDDVRAIQRECPSLNGISPELPLPSATGRFGSHDMDVSPLGVTADYAQMRNAHIDAGRFIEPDDMTSWSKVCVIGSRVRTDLFPGASAIGRTIQVGDQVATVVGVLAPKGRTFDGDQDTLVLLPLTTVQKRYTGNDRVGTIYASTPDLTRINEAKDEVWHVLMRRYHNMPGFRVDSFDNMLAGINQVLLAFTLVLGSIAGLALLVGGIGIMNIMLVSVTERTKEIGLRKAVGARRKDILKQFLIEAATLSGAGGILGVTIGSSSAYFLGYLTSFIPQLSNSNTGDKGLQIYVPPAVAIGAFIFSAAVGIFFGIYPAYRASMLDPIEALRHE